MAFLLFGALVAGCQQQEAKTAQYTVSSDDEVIRAAVMAESLGLRLDRTGGGMSRLSNSSNTVLLFPAAGGAYVNGTKVGNPEEVMVFTGETYVTRRLAKQIRDELRPAKPPTSPPTVSRQNDSPPPPEAKLGVVLLDAGHGGDDPGAIARTGRREKDLVLAVTLESARRLASRGVDVKFTRSSDVFVPLDDRVAKANQLQPDLFLSIHADASPNRSARGSTVFVPRRERRTSRSHQAGRAIVQALSSLQTHSRGLRTHEKNLRVLENTTCPAVLVELGFLTHPAEEQLLASPDYQQRLAEAISQAVLQYLQK